MRFISVSMFNVALQASPTGYSPEGAEGVTLNVISYLGCAVSIVFLSLTIFLLVLYRYVWR